jgi:hypothetical protein
VNGRGAARDEHRTEPRALATYDARHELPGYARAVLSEIPFTSRVVLAWLSFFRVLFDGAFAARVHALRLPAAPPEPEPATPVAAPPEPPRPDAALQLLALLQQGGRFVDFLEQDVTSFGDAEVGAAARVVHEGCRKVLRAHAKLAPVRGEEEGARETVEAGYAPESIKLTGNVTGGAPHVGTLRHKGWRVVDLGLPSPVRAYDASFVAPAEVEL